MMSSSKEDKRIILVSLLIGFILIYCGESQTSVPALYYTTPHSRSGTWIAFSSLKTSSDDIPAYTVTYTSALAANVNLNAVTSVSSFDLLSSTEFSFNTSLTSISYSGFIVKLNIIGNTYINLIKFNYLGMSWGTHPYANLLYYDCFLTSDLSYVSSTKSQTFKKQQLLNTVVDGSVFDIQSFITGMIFFNNKDNTKKIGVNSYISNNTNYITHEVSITGNSILQWICMGTVIIDNTLSPWNQNLFLHRMGSFNLDRPSASIEMTTFPSGYLPIYVDPDRKFFGLIELELALGKPYQIVEFKSENNLAVEVGYMSLASGGRMAYFFYAYRVCNDPAKQLYSLVDTLCYDTCPGGQIKDLTNNICLACHYSCQTCTGTSSTDCSACDGGTNFRTLNSAAHTCPCQNGYVENNVAKCSLCSVFIQNCATCSSQTVCTSCISTAFVFNPTTGACECAPNTYFISANNLCAPYPGCLYAQLFTNIVQCQTCDTAGHFELDLNTLKCKCVQNYTSSGAFCVDKCGDGINPQGNSTTYCDDGNLNGGDGCSATCAVETNFGCFVPPGQTVSYCSPVRSYSLKYLWTERVPEENSGLLVFEVSPSNPELSASDFTYYVESTIPHTIFTGSYDPSTSLLKIKVDYLETIEDQTHTIKITLDPYKMSNPSQSFTVRTSGVNFDLTFDSNSKMNAIMYYMSAAVSGIIVITAIIMIALNYKIGAVELLLSCQVVYLGVLASTNDNLSLYPLTGLKYLCGYNTLKMFEINKPNYQTTAILSSGTFAEYLLNFNITPAILILLILIILPLKINVWFKTYQRQKFTSPEMQEKLLHEEPTTSLKELSTNIKNAQLIADTYVDRVYFSISLIAFFPLVVYFAVQLAFIGRVGRYELNSFANIILSILLLLVDFCFFILIFQDSDKKAKMFNFGSKKLKNYPNRLMMAYFFLVCVFTVVLLSDFTLYVLIGMNVMVGIYVWFENPYEKFTLEHIDSLLKPIISLVCLLGIKAMGFFTLEFIVIPIVIIVLLLISTVITVVRTILVKIRREENAKRILEEAEMDDELDVDEKNLKQSTEGSEFNSQKNKKMTGKFENDSDSKKNQKKGKNETSEKKDTLSSIKENDQKVEKENENDSGGELNKNHEEKVNDPDELGEEDEDELTRIKRSLRQDLKKRRGVVNKANEEIITDIKKKIKSSKKVRKLEFDEDEIIKEHDI